MTTHNDRFRLSRRRILRGTGAGALGITALGTLVACGDDDSGEPGQADGEGSTSGDAPADGLGSDESGNGGSGDSGSGTVAALDDVPVGGTVAATSSGGDEILLARPSESEVIGFSAICTHQGCVVQPADDEIRCPCHGSVFDLLTGDNVSGPAPSPLEEFPVRVDGESIVEA